MRTILCHGCFDLLHPGHLEHLRQAREMGDRLVVSVTADKYIHKGPGRPVFCETERVAMLRALRCVDDVIVTDAPDAIPAILTVKPAVYVKGEDYQTADAAGNLDVERKAVEGIGGVLAFTVGHPRSSSALVNRYTSPLSDDAQAFMRGFRERHTVNEVMGWLDKAAALSAFLVGESIIDEYVYVTPSGKSPKESLVTFISDPARIERFGGGIDAVREHLTGWLKEVWVWNGGHPAVVKRRYVEEPFGHKVYSVATLDGALDSLVNPTRLTQANLTLIVDYGHGLIPRREDAAAIVSVANYVALTVQSNSLNWGFNLLTKWPHADYAVMDEMELRLACADKAGDIRDLVQRETRRFFAKRFVVTLGHKGCLGYDPEAREWAEVPALATRIVDRMGAGDAFLAATAPLARIGAPIDIIGFVGNVAAAIKVGYIGHSSRITQSVLRQWITGLMA